MPLETVVSSNTSVYVSGFNHDHRDSKQADPEAIPRYTTPGVSNTFLSNRVSWFYDFQGQSMTIDTACSSSMVCLHQAVQSLRSGESEMVRSLKISGLSSLIHLFQAVVSGTSVLAHPFEFTSMSQVRIPFQSLVYFH